MADWKSLPPGDEKYQAYLCSREWGLLRAAVHKRCGSICERCGLNKVDAVHHTTYIRRYAEKLEDLEGICGACHSATHGHTTDDLADPASAEAMLQLIENWCYERTEQAASGLGSTRWLMAGTFIGSLISKGVDTSGLTADAAKEELRSMDEAQGRGN